MTTYIVKTTYKGEVGYLTLERIGSQDFYGFTSDDSCAYRFTIRSVADRIAEACVDPDGFEITSASVVVSCEA